MCAAVAVSFDQAKVGMRVQDYWGRTGTIRWIGKLEKKDNPPSKETGKHFGIEYDHESENPFRSDGTWGGRTYFKCAPKKGCLVKPNEIYPEMNGERVAMLRERFGERVASWHDFELVKFCIARRFEMDKVYEMLEKHLHWRENFQPSAEEYFPQTMRDDYPCGYTGTTDYDENLIYCERPSNGGHCHPSEFVRKYTLPVIGRWHACGMEIGKLRMRATDYHCKRVCYIVDLLNVNSMTRPMIGFAQTLATVEQDNYPENLGRVFIVNCPTFFRFAWKLVKIFIDERTNKKINFCAQGKAVEVMKLVMPESEIPNFCGGTSNKWMETAGGIIGSTDPAKAWCGEGYSLPNMTDEELKEMQRKLADENESPIESFCEDETPSPTRSVGSDFASNKMASTTSGSPNAKEPVTKKGNRDGAANTNGKKPSDASS
ncbi:sec14 cytosolic factor [Leptomonas seymouri]|uniref:Sec14 cytosolic factor n=1 Tax=Leptomonas seymouri TaxID=5684 RepID=A0A0N1PF64_LEPSE|nr:sec14 cytosolic factor [Leptomonas seymouri]|eukprot:KPI88183.1 sec14 cytosolic factor [Leptomonas seymouri]